MLRASVRSVNGLAGVVAEKEEVEVSKTPYVKEEVVVKKKPVTETREFTEEVTSEKVNVSDSNV